MTQRPEDVDIAIDYLLDYEYFNPYQENIIKVVDYIIDLEEELDLFSSHIRALRKKERLS